MDAVARSITNCTTDRVLFDRVKRAWSGTCHPKLPAKSINQFKLPIRKRQRLTFSSRGRAIQCSIRRFLDRHGIDETIKTIRFEFQDDEEVTGCWLWSDPSGTSECLRGGTRTDPSFAISSHFYLKFYKQKIHLFFLFFFLFFCLVLFLLWPIRDWWNLIIGVTRAVEEARTSVYKLNREEINGRIVGGSRLPPRDGSLNCVLLTPSYVLSSGKFRNYLLAIPQQSHLAVVPETIFKHRPHTTDWSDSKNGERRFWTIWMMKSYRYIFSNISLHHFEPSGSK